MREAYEKPYGPNGHLFRCLPSNSSRKWVSSEGWKAPVNTIAPQKSAAAPELAGDRQEQGEGRSSPKPSTPETRTRSWEGGWGFQLLLKQRATAVYSLAYEGKPPPISVCCNTLDCLLWQFKKQPPRRPRQRAHPRGFGFTGSVLWVVRVLVGNFSASVGEASIPLAKDSTDM